MQSFSFHTPWFEKRKAHPQASEQEDVTNALTFRDLIEEFHLLYLAQLYLSFSKRAKAVFAMSHY
jgi:hypothetical protein